MPVLALSEVHPSPVASADLTVRWLALSLDVSLKAAALALIAVALLKLLRVRDVNIRHRVWAGVLAGMLLLPALTHVVPALQLPFTFEPDWFVAAAVVEPILPGSVAPAAPQPASPDITADFDRPTLQPGSNSFPGRDPSAFDRWNALSRGELPRHEAVDELPRAEPQPVASSQSAENPATGKVDDLAQPVASVPFHRRILRILPVLLCWGWLLGTALMTLRLLAGLWMAFRLQCESSPISPIVLRDDPIEARQRPRTRREIPVLECPLIRVPLTVGWLRPQVLLPAEWVDWTSEKLQAVLAHERMHAERGDCLLALLAEVNRCWYWFHPLSWWLRQHLSSLAEAACDDAAVDSTGDRARYARHLLEVAAAVSAERQRGRVVPLGVSMARRSQVETRINAILDFTRPLSQRLTWGTTIVLLAIIIPMIALAAALRPGDGKDDAVTEEVVVAEDETPVSDANGGPTPPLDPPANGGKEETAAAADDNSVVRDAANPVADVTFEYAGTVVDPDGKPVAGANVYLDYARTKPPADDPQRRVLSDAEGRFRFERRKDDFLDSSDPVGYSYCGLVATKDGFGFARGWANDFETTGRLEAELKLQREAAGVKEPIRRPNVLKLLPDDVPVRGRILDTEGRPVAGAKIEAMNVSEGAEGTLEAWESAAKKSDANEVLLRRHLTFLTIENFTSGPRALAIPITSTDTDGWFTLKGLGRERIAQVFVSGPAIETHTIHVRSRPGDTIKVRRTQPAPTPRPDAPLLYYPVEFTTVVGPSTPVEGRIADARTSQPVVGAVIKPERLAVNTVSGSTEMSYIQATTAVDGRFLLQGLPLGTNQLFILPPEDSPFLTTSVAVTTASQPNRVTRDVALEPGVVVRGQVTDQRSRAPVAGHFTYYAFPSEQATQPSPRPGPAIMRYYTDALGRYSLAVPRQKGILAFTARSGDAYPLGAGADEIDAPKVASGYGYPPTTMFLTNPRCIVTSAHRLMPFDPQPGTDEITLDLALEPGETIPGTVLSADGKPLRDFYVHGWREFVGWRKQAGEQFEVKGYVANSGRRALFYHPETNLVGFVELIGPAPEMLAVTLHPGATIVGRLVDDDGLPVANATIHMPRALPPDQMPRPDDAKTQGVLVELLDGRPIVTDSEGRFALKGIIPGLKYGGGVSGRLKFAGGVQQGYLGPIFTDVSAEPGETKDLGDLRPKPFKPQPGEKPKGAARAVKPENKLTQSNSDPKPPLDLPANGGRKSAGETVTLKGVVLTPVGKPAAGATVRAAVPVWAMMRTIVGEEFESPVSKTTADDEGRFTITISTRPFGDVSRLDARWQELWKKTAIAASLKGFGPAWIEYGELPSGETATLRLVEDLPIRGRVIDLEGRPVAGATLKLDDLHASNDNDLSTWLESARSGEPPWIVIEKVPRFVELRLIDVPAAFTTDRDGMIEIRGLGRERLAKVTFDGESVAHRDAMVVTRTMESFQRVISTPPFEAKEPVFGAEFTFTADPARTIEGIVRDAKTGEPLGGVSVESYKLVGYPYSNHRVLKAKSDATGRFRLVGMPKGKGNRLLAAPNDDQPYFMREVSVPDPIGLGPAKMEIELHRGIWITGRVTDKATGEPVPAVRVQYLPFLSNEFARELPEFADGNGDELRYQTKPDGTYRLVGLPGRAIVGANSVMKEYRRGIGYDRITGPKDNQGELLTYHHPVAVNRSLANAMEEIDPAADATDVSLDFQLDPGQSLRIRVVDDKGEPVVGLSADGLTWYGHVKSSTEPVLIAANLGPEDKRTILLRHKDRNIGRVVTIGPDEIRAGDVTVDLQPCAVITGQLLKNDDQPITDMVIRADVLPSGEYSPTLSRVPTDAQGRFGVTLLPGCRYRLVGEGGELRFVEIGDELAIEPGESKPLGAITFDKEGKRVSTKRKIDPAKPTGDERPSSKSAAAGIVVEGQE